MCAGVSNSVQLRNNSKILSFQPLRTLKLSTTNLLVAVEPRRAILAALRPSFVVVGTVSTVLRSGGAGRTERTYWTRSSDIV